MRRIALALLLIAAAPAPTPTLRAETWTATAATLAHDLTNGPAECLAYTDDAVEVGRALFRAPVLFGGPAARVGLSCESCHAGGRINTRFRLTELGGAVGAADVTSEWASKVRGDGMRNPVPIPDLVGARTRSSFGGRRVASLDDFIRGVIVEEFQGPPPPRAAFEGVVAYVRALSPEACPASGGAITLAGAAADVRRAVAAAAGRASADDAPTASLLLYAAQDAVARIVERLPRKGFAGERRALAQLAGELGAMRADPGRMVDTSRLGWDARFDGAVRRVARRESETYFDARALAAEYRRTARPNVP